MVKANTLEAYVQSACVDLANIVRNEVTQELNQRLLRWTPPPDVLTRFPFLGNMSLFVRQYAACFVVQVDPSTRDVLLGVDARQLATHGYPSELPTWLEYGHEALPPTPHIRPALAKVEYFTKEIVRGLQLWN